MKPELYNWQGGDMNDEQWSLRDGPLYYRGTMMDDPSGA